MKASYDRQRADQAATWFEGDVDSRIIENPFAVGLAAQRAAESTVLIPQARALARSMKTATAPLFSQLFNAPLADRRAIAEGWRQTPSFRRWATAFKLVHDHSAFGVLGAFENGDNPLSAAETLFMGSPIRPPISDDFRAVIATAKRDVEALGVGVSLCEDCGQIIALGTRLCDEDKWDRRNNRRHP